MARAKTGGPFPLRTVTVLVALMVLVGLVGLNAFAEARGAAAHPGASVSLTVTVGTPFAFTLSSNEVQPGQTVSVTLIQTSSVVHTFTLLNATGFQFNWSSSSSDSLPHILAFLAAHPPLVNFTFPAQAGTGEASFVAPAFGEYEYLCLEPGHFAAGMWGLLGSGEAGSGGGGATDTGPGAPVFIIAGTIAGLVVLSIVLAFVVGKREGSRHEMAPERLGYPESSSPSTPLSSER
ncbi:MAG: cupredoxin domain-containing protein [Thermoplasmata archaeon]|nr:cupredoxin domain-containing protein [Thermoplasmata archaeon]